MYSCMEDYKDLSPECASQAGNGTTSNGTDCQALAFNELKEFCDSAEPAFLYPKARCDTTRELAELAYNAGMDARESFVLLLSSPITAALLTLYL